MSSITLPNTITTYGENKGGIKSIELAPKEWLQDIWYKDQAQHCVTAKPALIAGKSWLKIEFKFQTASMEETNRQEDGGEAFSNIITGRVLKNTLEKNVGLRFLRLHQFVVITKDYNNVQHIIGNKDEGMMLTTDSKSTEQISQGTEYVIRLSCLLPEPAPLLVDNP